ncbi:MAG: hypothetical protein HOP28_12225 [Gemmatimonadales bacterium]|nr:hypothetical protein [Gemmatimonadales bacterium]
MAKLSAARFWIVGLAIIGLVAALWLAQRTARRNGLRADSLEVVADSQRTVILGEDSLRRAVLRRVLQVEVEKTELEAKLKTKPKIVYVAQVSVKPVNVEASAPVVDTPAAPAALGGSAPLPIRYAHFERRQAPFTLRADVWLPAPPDTARLSARIGLDPFQVNIRTSCSAKKAGGIRRAYVAFDSLPPGFEVTIARAEQSADVCNARGGFIVNASVPWWTLPAVGVVGALLGAIVW